MKTALVVFAMMLTACLVEVEPDPVEGAGVEEMAKPSCQSFIQCDDGDPCTNDACVNGACSYSYAADGTTCGDSDPCTTNVCMTGACYSSPIIGCGDD